MKKTKRRAAVLGDHKKDGSKFLPPFLSMGIPVTATNWLDDIFPELVWIALVRAQKSDSYAAKLCIALSTVAKEAVGKRIVSSFAAISSFGKLTPEESMKIVRSLPNDEIDDLRGTLAPLAALYPESPFSFLYPSSAADYLESTESGIAILQRAIRLNLDRRGKEATLTQRIFAYIPIALGLVQFGSASFVPDFASLDSYPESSESKLAGSKMRAQINGFVGSRDDQSSKQWCTYFWRQGYRISSCEIAVREPADLAAEGLIDMTVEALGGLPSSLERAAFELWLAAEIDVADNKKDEVLGGLLARQVRLTSQMASEPSLWALDLGLIVLRCIVDTYINLAWLCKFGSEKHFSDFVEYGLGQEKLLVEHFKAQSYDGKPISDEAKLSEDWIEGQIMPHFLPVEIGDWINKTKRQMAEDLGVKEIYSLAFSPFSGAVHGMWHSIARVNLQRCYNPLHKFHRVPNFESQPLYMASALQAIDVMDRTFEAFCESKKLQCPKVCKEALAQLKEAHPTPA